MCFPNGTLAARRFFDLASCGYLAKSNEVCELCCGLDAVFQLRLALNRRSKRSCFIAGFINSRIRDYPCKRATIFIGVQ